MEKQSSQELSIENKSAGFSRVEKPKVAEIQLQLLPYDVLRDILSRLSIKDVVRMSTLSGEWRQQRICHPDLVFTKDTFGISTDPDPDFTKTIDAIIRDTDTKRASWTAEFIVNVDSVLRPLWSTSTTTTTTLDKFAIEFALRRKHKYHIDRWVNFSIASRAKYIAFDFTFDIDCAGPGCDQYKDVFPLCKLSGPSGSCVTSLVLGYVWLKLPPSFCGITNLRKLTLKTVSISGGDLQRLLLSCALLEHIDIEWCSPLSSLRIGQELCRLQYLRVRRSELEMLELHAPNLTKFEFDEDLAQIVLSDCLRLSEATFVSNMRTQEFNDYDFDDLAFTFTELALPHVQKLFLLLNLDQVLRFSENQTSFINLRHLNMNLEIGWDPYDDSWAIGFIHLLQLSPLLEELELHVGRDRFCPPTMRMVTAVQGPLHHHLKRVHMSGFCDVLGLAELALYSLGNATALERMVVDPVAYAETLHTDDIYSVSKAGSIEGDHYHVDQNRMFAEQILGSEEFRHIVTIL
ncbi:hypothetical protein CFC21_020258 [Triticum aestivum]|uniref:F-box domain-containing protein n=2 Tax=Triticum aestivum TaxID=4565 RepID=A0A9R1J5M5_WHEAT|nr:uncharacterized protein LOC123191152 [Triticum aestivum]XP_044459873.1 uncharacterized protein LOC123191152 [Triticum aestivum]KAF7005111.1 hypothetical protein CFC21_020258 [Triticum aestivum]